LHPKRVPEGILNSLGSGVKFVKLIFPEIELSSWSVPLALNLIVSILIYEFFTESFKSL
jgi:hypothetical protein